MPSKEQRVSNAIAKAREYFGKGRHDQALTACDRALKADPNSHKAHDLRWMILGEKLAPDEMQKIVNPEVETFLNSREETPEALFIAYWGYMRHPGRTQNVPDHLFERMQKYPGTDTLLTALLGLAERSQDPLQQWEYYRRIIDEFTAEDTNHLSWYVMAHEDMLRLAEQDRSLARNAYLDKLIDRYLQAQLTYCRQSQQSALWPYFKSVNYRLSLEIGLAKALDALKRAEERLQEKEEREFLEHMGGSIEWAQREIALLYGRTYLKLEQWKKAYSSLRATAPKNFTTLHSIFGESTIEHFWMLARTAEGLGKLDIAMRNYADAHFAPQPHAEALAGLKRTYKTRHGSLQGFKAFLATTEVQYRKRENRQLQKIRRHLVGENLDQTAANFNLKDVDGRPFRLSHMRGSVVLFDVWASWCGWCHHAIPQLEEVYEHFIDADDVHPPGRQRRRIAGKGRIVPARRPTPRGSSCSIPSAASEKPAASKAYLLLFCSTKKGSGNTKSSVTTTGCPGN